MRVKYDQDVDVLTIRFSDAPVEESDENKPGVILDYDKTGKIVGIEILNASKQIENQKSLEYAVAWLDSMREDERRKRITEGEAHRETAISAEKSRSCVKIARRSLAAYAMIS